MEDSLLFDKVKRRVRDSNRDVFVRLEQAYLITRNRQRLSGTMQEFRDILLTVGQNDVVAKGDVANFWKKVTMDVLNIVDSITRQGQRGNGRYNARSAQNQLSLHERPVPQKSRYVTINNFYCYPPQRNRARSNHSDADSVVSSVSTPSSPNTKRAVSTEENVYPTFCKIKDCESCISYFKATVKPCERVGCKKVHIHERHRPASILSGDKRMLKRRHEPMALTVDNLTRHDEQNGQARHPPPPILPLATASAAPPQGARPKKKAMRSSSPASSVGSVRTSVSDLSISSKRCLSPEPTPDDEGFQRVTRSRGAKKCRRVEDGSH